MKILLACALLALTPVVAQAECSAKDFAIKDVKTSVSGSGAAARLSLTGELVNNCATPSAAQIRVDAKDSGGNVLQSKQGWPAGTTNIAPGTSAKFDMGRRFRLQSDMSTYTVSVVSVRSW